GNDRHAAQGVRWPAGGQAADSVGQRQRLYRQGVQSGACGERLGPSPDQAPLPRGKWLDRADAPDAARGVGWGNANEPAGGRKGICPRGAALHQTPAAQRLGGLTSADYCRVNGNKRNGTRAHEAGAGAASEAGEEPGVAAADTTVHGGGGCCFLLRPVCTTAVETIQLPCEWEMEVEPYKLPVG